MELSFIVVDNTVLNSAVVGSIDVSFNANSNTFSWTPNQYANVTELTSALASYMDTSTFGDIKVVAFASASATTVMALTLGAATIVAAANDDGGSPITDAIQIKTTSLGLADSLKPHVSRDAGLVPVSQGSL